MIRLRGSSYAAWTRGRNAFAPSTIAGSISIVSTAFSFGDPSSVAVVSPDPNPMTAARWTSGRWPRASSAASRIVYSSVTGPTRSRSRIATDASGLPLVAIVVMGPVRKVATVAVFPSRVNSSSWPSISDGRP